MMVTPESEHVVYRGGPGTGRDARPMIGQVSYTLDTPCHGAMGTLSSQWRDDVPLAIDRWS